MYWFSLNYTFETVDCWATCKGRHRVPEELHVTTSLLENEWCKCHWKCKRHLCIFRYCIQ